MSSFANVGYRSIQHIFKNAGVEYSNHAIINAERLEFDLEDLSKNIHRDHSTVVHVSLDAVKVYPSIKIDTINSAIQYFARDLPHDHYNLVLNSLRMLKLSLASTYFAFRGKYYHTLRELMRKRTEALLSAVVPRHGKARRPAF